MPRPRFAPQAEAPGLAPRRIAADILEGVLRRRRPLDEQLDGAGAHPGLKSLSDRDRALMRRILATVLRRLGTLQHLVGKFLERGLPADAARTESALLIGAAQILWLDVPDHAAVDLAVRLVQADRKSAHHVGLVNAVLRRCAREGKQIVESDEEIRDLPPWLLARWRRHYGDEKTASIARALSYEPPLDLTVKSDLESWAQRLHGEVLPTGTVRTLLHGPITMLPGFSEGEWWVQDAAAALPAKLFGDVRGKRIVDLCAAPGGKTAQLATAGANVVAVDRSPARLRRLRDNLTRLKLDAEIVTADATEWSGDGLFDGVLVDAPCAATGTLRRHPDIAWLKQEADLTALTELQQRLATHASSLLKPGGTMVFCTCSMEPEEGEQAIAALLASDSSLKRVPIDASEIGGLPDLITAEGDLRSLPCHLPHEDPRLGGLDGFFAARLIKS